ncbi:hypothetical protein Lal_00033508 [Lupinus albus]|nr:hypothetical protein Lal_00033508 [Lupinus albus]
MQHPITTENFAILPTMLSMVMQNQFGGATAKDPNDHIEMFLKFCETIKVNGASKDNIQLPHSFLSKRQCKTLVEVYT